MERFPKGRLTLHIIQFLQWNETHTYVYVYWWLLKETRYGEGWCLSPCFWCRYRLQPNIETGSTPLPIQTSTAFITQIYFSTFTQIYSFKAIDKYVSIPRRLYSNKWIILHKDILISPSAKYRTGSTPLSIQNHRAQIYWKYIQTNIFLSIDIFWYLHK